MSAGRTTERRVLVVLIAGLGVAVAAGVGLALGVGAEGALKVVAFVGGVTALGATHRLFRTP